MVLKALMMMPIDTSLPDRRAAAQASRGRLRLIHSQRAVTLPPLPFSPVNFFSASGESSFPIQQQRSHEA